MPADSRLVQNGIVRAGRFRIVWTATVFTALCGRLPAQSTRAADLATGKVLVMQQNSADPNFAESVILLIHYDKDGVLGLRLNQPSAVPLSRLKDLQGARNRPDRVYVGGPVELETVTALVRSPNAPPDAMHVAPDLYAVQTLRGIEAALNETKNENGLRVYLGYSGWVMPQLQNEVNFGSWFIFEHGERYVFDREPRTLWKRLLDRTGAQFAFAPAARRHGFVTLSAQPTSASTDRFHLDIE
ncbi:MAG TPA: YqgE/AlgH family protein [Bryobacteraceae bacterium]|nr:YqgE/AlgH family protein [Bryobacteraceae bacterium]